MAPPDPERPPLQLPGVLHLHLHLLLGGAVSVPYDCNHTAQLHPVGKATDTQRQARGLGSALGASSPPAPHFPTTTSHQKHRSLKLRWQDPLGCLHPRASSPELALGTALFSSLLPTAASIPLAGGSRENNFSWIFPDFFFLGGGRGQPMGPSLVDTLMLFRLAREAGRCCS